MKKTISVIIILALLAAFMPTVFASSLPFTDDDYARADFGIRDYEKYVVDSIDKNGCEWPVGTKVIADEIPSGHKSIARYKKVVIPRDIEIIGHSCFMGRDGITDEVVDFKTLTELKCIGKYAFKDTDITDLDLSNTKVVRIEEQALYVPKPHNFIAPSTLRYIGDFVFPDNCRIEHIQLNEGLRHIGVKAFGGYNGTLVIPSTVKYIGYSAMTNATVYVYKGSYAEQWCKENNQRYHYVNESTTNTPLDDSSHIMHRVGPLNVIGYYNHFVGEYPIIDGSKPLAYKINTFPGAVLETAYDGVEVYYAPHGIKDGEYIDKTAVADTTEFIGTRRGGKVTLADYGVTVKPTKRLETGWQKGVRWTFNKPVISAPQEHYLIVEYDGMTYRYTINMNWGEQYEKVRNDPNYNKMGFDTGDDSKSGTSKLIVDGKEYYAESYNLYGNNYFRLRDIAMFISGSAKQFDITYDNEKRAVNLITGKAYTPVGSELKSGDGKMHKAFSACPSPIYCNGKEVLMRARLIEGTNYIMLRDLGKIIDFEINWNEETNCIVIDTTKCYK